MSHIRRIAFDGPLDLGATVGPFRMKAGGRPRMGPNRAEFGAHTPLGPGAVLLESGRNVLEARGHGPGASWLLEHVADLVGLHDEPARFDPPPGLIRELARRRPGLRIGRTRRVVEALVPAILGQRVTSKAAGRSYRALMRRHGVTVPGTDLRLGPPPHVLAELPLWEYHRAGVEQRRAATVIEVARRAQRLEAVLEMDRASAYQRLTAVRGVGPWTAGHVMGIAWGDEDAVPVGDYHLPNTVAWALAGEDRADDARMLELLEPFAGHRRRVVLLLKGARVEAPKYGPRLAIRSFEHQ